MSNKKKKYTIQSFISWAAAIIILALGAKILHYAWAEYLIIVGFALEFIVFMIMGFTYQETNNIEVTQNDSRIDDDLINTLTLALTKVAESTNNNSKIINALVSEIGVSKLSETLNRTKAISELELNDIQNKISLTGENFEKLNQTIVELNNSYSKQVQAFRSN